MNTTKSKYEITLLTTVLKILNVEEQINTETTEADYHINSNTN